MPSDVYQYDLFQTFETSKQHDDSMMANNAMPRIVKTLMRTIQEAAVSIPTPENIAWIRHVHGSFSVLSFSSLHVVFRWFDPPNVAGGPSLGWISFSQAMVRTSICMFISAFLLT